jgi:hypothetical protein
MNCSICQERFTENPCDAHPITDGPCCPRCDDLIVTPVRILREQLPRQAELITVAFQSASKMRELSEKIRRTLKDGKPRGTLADIVDRGE